MSLWFDPFALLRRLLIRWLLFVVPLGILGGVAGAWWAQQQHYDTFSVSTVLALTCIASPTAQTFPPLRYPTFSDQRNVELALSLAQLRLGLSGQRR